MNINKLHYISVDNSMDNLYIILGAICIVFAWAFAILSQTYDNERKYLYVIIVSSMLLVAGVIFFIYGVE
jgi:hypothetical protein